LELEIPGTIETSQPSLARVFPTPYALSTAHLEAVGVPKRRSKSIQALAKAVHEGMLRLDGSPSLAATIEDLRTTVPGIGAWTADYIAMRVYREPDAFPSSDLGLRKAVSDGGAPVTVQELEARAEAWRPWRAYAAMYLWESLDRSEFDGPLRDGVQDSMRPPPTDQVA
jgi:3-methyladenine DNA glycosylase/8-oxoguanine DNA glycosylase